MAGVVAKIFVFLFVFFTQQLRDLPPHEGAFLHMKERKEKKENEKEKKGGEEI